MKLSQFDTPPPSLSPSLLFGQATNLCNDEKNTNPKAI